jgi:hypothetical protein
MGNLEIVGVSYDLPEDPILLPDGHRIDALRQCVRIAHQMIALVQTAVAASGVQPKLIHITDADMV